jgi:hypothetical protein
MEQEPEKQAMVSSNGSHTGGEPKETIGSRDRSQPLPIGRLVIVGACMTLTSIINGWSVIMTTIMLDLLAEGLNLGENNLQWTVNAFLLSLVSHSAASFAPTVVGIVVTLHPFGHQGCFALVAGRASDIAGGKAIYTIGTIWVAL